VVNLDLIEGVYDQEWKSAIQLVKDGKVDTVMITSWNEYVERTEVEPRYGATAYNHDPYFLYNKTKDYVNGIKLLKNVGPLLRVREASECEFYKLVEPCIDDVSCFLYD
jgi:hypothetical protein